MRIDGKQLTVRGPIVLLSVAAAVSIGSAPAHAGPPGGPPDSSYSSVQACEDAARVGVYEGRWGRDWRCVDYNINDGRVYLFVNYTVGTV